MDFKSLFETAQKVQGEMARVKEGLAGMTVTGEAGGGMVTCTANGKGDVMAIEIDPSLMEASDPAARKLLQDMVVGATNVALERARELAERELAKVAGGLGLPPGVLSSS